MTETTWISCGALSMCLPLKTLSLSSHRRLCFLLTLGNWSSFYSFVSDSEVSISHHMIIMKFRCGVQSMMILSAHCFVQRLDQTRPSQTEVELNCCYFDLYNPSRIDVWRHFAYSQKVHDPRVHRKSLTSSFCKLVANNFASPCTVSKDPVARKNSKIMYAMSLPRKNWSEFSAAALRHFLLFGSWTACQHASSRLTQSSLWSKSKSGKLGCLVIDRNITSLSKDLAISTSLTQSTIIWGSAGQRTNPSSEVDFPALKFQRVRLFSKIPFRNENSPTIHHTPVRISSTSMIGHNHFNFGSGVIEYVHSTVPNSWGEDAKIFEMWKIAEGCPSWTSHRSQKRFLKYPYRSVYDASIQNRSAARFWDSEMEVAWSGTWVAPELLPNSGSYDALAPDKEFTLFCKSRIWAIIWHNRKIPLLLHGQFFNSRLSCMISFIATNSSRFFNFFWQFFAWSSWKSLFNQFQLSMLLLSL